VGRHRALSFRAARSVIGRVRVTSGMAPRPARRLYAIACGPARGRARGAGGAKCASTPRAAL
jgi:hypothetical protein